MPGYGYPSPAKPVPAPPSGPAGGDLAGAYPNPTVGLAKITPPKMLVNADLSFGGFKATSLAAGVLPTDGVNKGQLDAALVGLSWKMPVVVRSQVDLALAAMPAAVDGVALVAGERFLAGSQADAKQNGVYDFNGAGNAATRSPDADSTAELNAAAVFVERGTDADKAFVQTTDDPVIGADDIVFAQFAAGGGGGGAFEFIEEKTLAAPNGNIIIDTVLNGDLDGTYYGEYCILDNAGGAGEGYLNVNAIGPDGAKFKSVASDGATRRDYLWLWSEGGHPNPQPISGSFWLVGRRGGNGANNGRFRKFSSDGLVQWDGATIYYGGTFVVGGIVDYTLNITSLQITGPSMATGSWLRLWKLKHQT